jgi:hypothetical protein
LAILVGVKRLFLFACACSLFLLESRSFAQTNEWNLLKVPTPKGYVCYRATALVIIDGKFDELDWKSAPWTDAFQDIEGDLKSKPRFRTRAKMLWNADYFYIFAEIQEPHVSGTLTKHDSVIFQDNDFEVFIDPNGDNHEYYEIEINALNTEWDLFLKMPYKDGVLALDAWEIPGFKSAVHIDGTLNQPHDTDRGWSVELAIPWKALAEHAHRPSPPNDGDQWRVNFSRVEWNYDVVDGKYRKVPNRKEDNWVWSPQGIVDMHRPEKWGYVQFSTAKFGQTEFVADPAAPLRDSLHEIYYAQRAFRAVHKRWAMQVDELQNAGLLRGAIAHRPVLESLQSGFRATVQAPLGAGSIERWHIQQDSRIWRSDKGRE